MTMKLQDTYTTRDIVIMEVYKDNGNVIDDTITVERNNLVMTKYIPYCPIDEIVIEDIIDDQALTNTEDCWTVLLKPITVIPDFFILWTGHGRSALMQQTRQDSFNGPTTVATKVIDLPFFTNVAHLPNSRSTEYTNYLSTAKENNMYLIDKRQCVSSIEALETGQVYIDACWIDKDKDIQESRGRQTSLHTRCYDTYTMAGNQQKQILMSDAGEIAITYNIARVLPI